MQALAGTTDNEMAGTMDDEMGLTMVIQKAALRVTSIMTVALSVLLMEVLMGFLMDP